MEMTGKEKIKRALSRQPLTGQVPTLELVFYLTMEALGEVHPTHRIFTQWDQMSDAEREAQRQDAANVYIETAKKYGHSAISVHPIQYRMDELIRFFEIMREKAGDDYFLIFHDDPTFEIPHGDTMMDFSVDMYENPGKLKAQSDRRIKECAQKAEELAKRGLADGVAMCSDYCFNANPYFTGDLFTTYIAPVLEKMIGIYHDLGFKVIKHTDGNIMPIIDYMVDCKPDALHSLDPQGGVDLGEVKKKYGDRVALIGNVNCGLLQTGTEEEVEADVRRALRQGMDGFGYIFATSNCAYTGLPLERYELMNRIWREEGIYK